MTQIPGKTQRKSQFDPKIFFSDRGCMDQVFAVRQVCEKYLANGKDVFWPVMDLEKAYDTIDRHGMWQMLRVYGVGGKLLKAVQSFLANEINF